MGIKVKVVWTAETKPDFVSRAIMAFQRTPYSHVAIIFDGMICHAIGEGVCFSPAADYLADHVVVLERELELACSAERFMGFIEGESGKEYSEAQLLLIALGLKWFANGDEKRICSEFVANIISKFGLELIRWEHLDHVTPKCLEKVLKPTRVA